MFRRYSLARDVRKRCPILFERGFEIAEEWSSQTCDHLVIQSKPFSIEFWADRSEFAVTLVLPESPDVGWDLGTLCEVLLTAEQRSGLDLRRWASAAAQFRTLRVVLPVLLAQLEADRIGTVARILSRPWSPQPPAP